MPRGLCDAEVYVTMYKHCVDSLSTLSHLIHRMRHFIRNSTAPAIPLLGIHTKELKAGSQRDICTLMFIAPFFTIAKRWEQPECPWTGE